MAENKTIRDGFIFYRSFFEGIKELPRDIQGEVLTAIMEYGLNGETTENLKPVAKAMFALIKPQIDEARKENHSIDKIFHWNWKGGKTKNNHLIRNSPEMKRWRKKVFERDNFTCMTCKKVGGKLNAHHIEPFSTHPELMFDVENGLTLCHSCHVELHKTERKWVK